MSKTIDGIFLVALALVILGLVFTICVGLYKREPEETQETTVAITTAETTEAETEPTQAETIATEPPTPLYDVPLDEDLQKHIIETANYHDIDPAIIMAIAWKESTYRVDAIGDGGNSLGLCQVQPRWHSARMEKLNCPNLLDPYQNVTVACDYLCELVNRYGSMDKALTAYNRGSYAGTVTDYARTVMAKADEMVVK